MHIGIWRNGVEHPFDPFDRIKYLYPYGWNKEEAFIYSRYPILRKGWTNFENVFEIKVWICLLLTFLSVAIVAAFMTCTYSKMGNIDHFINNRDNQVLSIIVLYNENHTYARREEVGGPPLKDFLKIFTPTLLTFFLQLIGVGECGILESMDNGPPS